MREAVPRDIKFGIAGADHGADRGDPQDDPEIFQPRENRHRTIIASISAP